MHEEQMSLDSVGKELPAHRMAIGDIVAIIVVSALAIGGIALWSVREALGYTGDANLLLMLVWLAFALSAAALVIVKSRSNRFRVRLTTAFEQLAASHAKLESLARHDLLTGVLNRRALIETLDWELLRSKRTGHPFCFAIIDLDHFRAINEKFGSECGDRVLKMVADTAIKLLRALDRFGRIGGEEFGIVLPATWLDQGVIAMGRLTKAVGACDWDNIAQGLNVTFSAGITTNAVNDTAEIILKRAEEALMQAKREGRNRIVQAEEELPDMPPIDID